MTFTKVIHGILVYLLFLILTSGLAFGGQKTIKSGHDILSIKNELVRTYKLGYDYLKKTQNPAGWWSTPDYPALTGLAVFAFLTSSEYKGGKEKPEFINKALDFIVSNAHENGAIYKKGLPNYNTAICIMALLSAMDEKYHPYILKGRRYLASIQLDRGKKGVADEPFDGGVGYGTKDHSDMSNTHIALEAMKYSEFLESDDQLALYKDLQGLQKNRLDWDAALKFIERCQNLPGVNDQAWSSADEKNKGGFIYYPGNSKAGEETLPDGKKALRSEGSMTYAGLLSFIFADLKKDDPRVQAAYKWIRQNYTLDENPGVGRQGLYYYYHTMAKALTAYDEDFLVIPEGKEINWRKELTIKLIQTQREDGSWVNETARWWENDPNLVTSYVLISLNRITPALY